MSGSNRRHPTCKAGVLPTELMAHNLVDEVGLEPTMPGAGDLQSPGVTNFPTHPYL